MDLNLKNKKAFITGSTSGIGYAIANALLNEGVSVVVNGRTQDRVDQAIKNLSASNPFKQKIAGIVADVATSTGAEKAISELNDVDILINNFGSFFAKSFEDVSDDEWLKIFNANVMSGVRLSRAFLPMMKEKKWGRIVFIASESGINIPVEMIHYGVTKTAQIALARGLAETTSGTNVTVNSILPGPTLSEGVEKFIADLAAQNKISKAKQEELFFQDYRPSSLIKRFLAVEEVANMVAYICSPLAAGTNGAALRVEGGLLRSIV